MRILHVVASYLPAVRYGGTIVSVHGLCRGLARRGHDVHVFTTSVDGDVDSDVPHGSPVAVDGVKVWYFPCPRARRIYWSPALGARLRSAIRDFDVVHTHAIYLWPLWTAARTAQRAGVPYVVSPRGMLEKGLIEQKSPWLKAALVAFVEKRTLEYAAAIHVTSAREAREAGAFGFSLPPLCEIPNGVDLAPAITARVTPAIEAITSGPPYVLFLGRINWKKGLDRLLRALRYLPDARLVVAGNDEEGYRQVLAPIVASEGVADRVVFAGAVAGANKARLLQRAQLLVLPSYSENFGNVVLEALAAGRPVVVTPEVGLADLVREAGVGLVADGAAEPLAAAIGTLLNDSQLRETFGARGRTLVADHYTWDAVATQMERLYENVTAGRRQPC